MEVMIFSASRYHDVNVPNLWNPVGNPWKRDDSIFVHCYDVIYSTHGRHHHHHPDDHRPHSIHDHHHLCPLLGCNQHLVIIIVLIITVLILIMTNVNDDVFESRRRSGQSLIAICSAHYHPYHHDGHLPHSDHDHCHQHS